MVFDICFFFNLFAMRIKYTLRAEYDTILNFLLPVFLNYNFRISNSNVSAIKLGKDFSLEILVLKYFKICSGFSKY